MVVPWSPKSLFAPKKSISPALELFIKDLSEQKYSCKENLVHDNLTTGEGNALKLIQGWTDHSIYLQDKGARLVIMKDSDFDKKSWLI